MSFARGTTPTLSIKFSATKYPTLDLTEAVEMVVTFQSGSKRVNKMLEDLVVTERQIDVLLTQQDAFKLDREAMVQVNWLTADGKRFATAIKSLPIDEQLYERVMQNE